MGRADPGRGLGRASASTCGSRRSSATCRRRQASGRSEQRRRPRRGATWWEDPAAGTYYFIGKDNIWSSTRSIWPAMLMAYGGLNLPYDVPANQYVNFERREGIEERGRRRLPCPTTWSDTSRTRSATASAANMPESPTPTSRRTSSSAATTTSWSATWGNLVNRVLTMTYRNFGGAVPEPGTLREQDEALLAAGDAALASVGESLAGAHFREALRAAMSLRAGHEPLPQPGRALEDAEGGPRQRPAARSTQPSAPSRRSRSASTPSCRSRPSAPTACWVTRRDRGTGLDLPASGCRDQAPEPAPLFKKLDVPAPAS